MSNSVGTTQKSKNGIRVSKREYVGPITLLPSADFQLSQLSQTIPGYDINPANQLLFPWLAQVAVSYEMYRFTDLKFEMVSSSPTTYPGRVYAAVDYDFDDPVASGPSAMLANQTSVSLPVWESGALKVDIPALNRAQPARYVISAKRVDPEPRTTMGGFLMVGGSGLTSGAVLDLWVSYSVELSVPQANDTVWVEQSVASNTYQPHNGSGMNEPIFARVSGSPPAPNLEVVTPGEGTTPAMQVLTKAATTAVKLGSILTESVDLVGRFVETAVTPANVLLKSPKFDASINGPDGAVLGMLSDLPLNKATAGPVNGVSINTAGAALEFVRTVALKELRKAFPLAAYLVPFITGTTAALTSGTMTAGIRGGFSS